MEEPGKGIKNVKGDPKFKLSRKISKRMKLRQTLGQSMSKMFPASENSTR